MGFRIRHHEGRRHYRTRGRSGVVDAAIAAACGEEMAVIVDQRSTEYAPRTAA